MKVISMDVWNTLIWSNPEYARERARYLSSELSLPEDIVKRAYYKVKNESDKAAEQKSECLSSINIYKKFLILLGRQDCDWLKLRHGLESLFMEYPPFFLPDTVRLLHLIQDNNTTLSIASNTNFIRGKVLYASILSKWGINWKFKVFSDEVKQPKPHPRFWKIVIKNAQKHTGATPEEILHIGDNKICDGSCKQASIQFCHVNTPRDVVDVLGTIHTAEAIV